MADVTSRNIRLGVFVIAAAAMLIGSLYFIGNKQNLFGNTFKISARFHNVNGLMQGNNVRFGGIDVGTVESVEIISDTSIEVVMVIEKDVQKFIKKNAMATIGSDGLMGNKLVNLNGGSGESPSVKEGDVLKTVRPVEMDETIKTLNVTNENIKVITTNLRHITDKINSPNSFWSLLMDTVISTNIKASLVNIKQVSNQAVYITGDLKKITGDMKQGKGAIGALITDTVISKGLKQTVIKFEALSDSVARVTGNVTEIIQRLKNGQGTMGILLTDTSLIHELNQGITILKNGGANFNENMEAVKHSWPFKKYYRKKNKQTPTK